MLHLVANHLEFLTDFVYNYRMQNQTAVDILTHDEPVISFLGWFQREYLKRRKKNASYSVRAFANYLEISAATVSHLLSGKRTPSAKFADKLFIKLDINPKEKETILFTLKKRKNEINLVDTKDSDYVRLAMDSFKLLSDWHHFAILELTSVSDFKFDYSWIADQLNISVTEARDAVIRMIRMDLLQINNGKLIKTNSFVTNEDPALTSSAHKQLQRHILQKALDAIDNTPMIEKDISSMTMAIDETKLPQAIKLITKFRRDLCKYLENGKQTKVYNLGIQLYPISKGIK